MTPKDWNTQEEAIAAAKAEILAAIEGTDARLEMGVQTVKSIQHGTVSKTGDITISEVNVQKSICFTGFSSYFNPGSGGSAHQGIYAFLKNSTTLYVQCSNSGNGGNGGIWYVVEFY